MNEVRFPYKPSKVPYIIGILLYGACTSIAGNEAISNNGFIIDRGFILESLNLSSQEATLFYGVIAGGSLLLVLKVAFFLVKLTTISNREIVISNDSITLPKSVDSDINITVYFCEITNITLEAIHGTIFITINYSGGKKLIIGEGLLPNKQSFEELYLQLLSRTNEQLIKRKVR